MQEIGYRLFLNDGPASQEETDRVEQIVVEQEVDMAWEARLDIPIGADEQGLWSSEDEVFAQPFNRVRIEVQVAGAAFVPLIDGPVVGSDARMSGEPGQSMLTVRVQDDSALLNRNDLVAVFEERSDDEIAVQLFGEAPEIAGFEIELTPAPPGGIPAVQVQRGTSMQLLRRLARRQGYHAYVLPGEAPGQSIGVFKPFTTRNDGLPDLILLGEDRNLESFSVVEDALMPASFTRASLAIADKGVSDAASSFSDVELLGPEPAYADEGRTGKRLLLPGGDESIDLTQSVTAAAALSTYAFEATGEVMGDRYAGVLTPYRVVTCRGLNGRLSGDYLIKQVTHTLTRGTYGQSFTVMRNARSEGAGGGLGGLAGSIF